MTAGSKMRHTAFTDFDICDRLVPLRKLYFDLLFQGEIFEMLISRKEWELAQKCVISPSQICISAIKWNHFESRTRWPSPTSSGLKLQIVTKLFLQICLHLCGTRRRVALVVVPNGLGEWQNVVVVSINRIRILLNDK